MVLDSSLLNTQHYKVWIKGKVEKSRERSRALPYTLVAIEKGAYRSPSATVTNFTFIYIYIYLYRRIIDGIILFLKIITDRWGKDQKNIFEELSRTI